MPAFKKGFRTLAMIAALGGLGTGAALAADPSWDEAAGKLRAVQLPSGNAEAILVQAKERKLSPAVVMEWTERMLRLQQAGVPAALMGERIVQGLIKGVPAPRLGQALETLQANLTWAKQAVDQHVPKAEVRANPAQFEEACRNLDSALRAGLTRPQLEQIFGTEALTLQQMATLARVAADLHSWNAAPQATVRVLSEAARGGVPAKELDRLEAKFAAGIAAGRPADNPLAEFEQGIKEFRSGNRENLREEMREQMHHERMQDFKGPSGSPGGPGGYPGY